MNKERQKAEEQDHLDVLRREVALGTPAGIALQSVLAMVHTRALKITEKIGEPLALARALGRAEGVRFFMEKLAQGDTAAPAPEIVPSAPENTI